jgi:ferredoxin
MYTEPAWKWREKWKECRRTERNLSDDEDIDFETVESHSRVERKETGRCHSHSDGIRGRACLYWVHKSGAMIGNRPFHANREHGRARVFFNQWGDDEETIQVPLRSVDCIHYIPYDELVTLEVERRDQHNSGTVR